jgi:hypothetical protein
MKRRKQYFALDVGVILSNSKRQFAVPSRNPSIEKSHIVAMAAKNGAYHESKIGVVIVR